MKIFKKVVDIQQYLNNKRKQNAIIGFVPTMGALHAGHMSLCTECDKLCDITVVSIFVNPTQFNDKKDLEKYPRTIDKDILALLNVNCDVLFLPEVEEIYPHDSITETYQLDSLETLWEGAFRPGHFQGVCQVVDRLFSIIRPDKVFFGQKDYQQCMVIKKLIQNSPFFNKIQMHIVPIMREADGLAMSSRNMRLTDEQKTNAAILNKVLLFIKNNIQPGHTEGVLHEAAAMLSTHGFKTDYIAIVDAATLEPVVSWDGNKPIVIIAAAFLGDVRLIDNMIV